MNEALQRIYDSVPADEPRSRLEPYRELILRWRRQGRSYRRIQQLLAEKCNIQIAYEPLRRFVRRRSRPRSASVEGETEPPASSPPPGPKELARPGAKLSAEERATQLQLIRSLNKPALQEERKPRWTFDPDKPRTNRKP